MKRKGLPEVPCDPAAEAAVIASMILDPGCIDAVLQRVDRAAFHLQENQLIFDAVCAVHHRLNGDGAQLDGLLVKEELERQGKLEAIGGASYLRDVLESVPSSASVAYYQEIVLNRQARRDMVRAGKHLIDGATDLTREIADELSGARMDLDEIAAPPKRKTGSKLEGMFMRVSTNEMKRIRWLVRDHFPLGKLSIVAGLPGTTKSLFSLFMIAAMKGKATLPAITPNVPVQILPGNALLVTSEDDPADCVAPRLAAYGLDPQEVPIYRGTKIVEPDGSSAIALFDLTKHLEVIDCFLEQNPDTRLLVLDPIQSFVGATDINSNVEVNHALTALSSLAERRNVAVLIITHFSKKTDTSAMDRVTGSRGFSGTVRAMWVVTVDPENTDRHIMSCVKMQYARKPAAMAHTIQEVNLTVEGLPTYIPILKFEPDRVDVNPDELVLASGRHNGRQGQAEKCMQWIEETLIQWAGPMELKLLRERALAKYSLGTFQKAKDAMELYEGKMPGEGKSWRKCVSLQPIEGPTGDADNDN